MSVLRAGLKAVRLRFLLHFKKLSNRFKRILFGKRENLYVFLLVPNFCGSTLLTEFISTSRNVSGNNTFGTREGQQLPELKSIMWNHSRTWDPDLKYPWPKIKKVWESYWDATKPILIEKSPSNIVRAKEIEKEFKPNLFLVMVRNPYAHCEGLIRRSKRNNHPRKAAAFAIQSLMFQKDNLENLENTISITYEEFTQNPVQVKNKIIGRLPQLGDLNTKLISKAHNFKKVRMAITDLNDEKIARLDAEQLRMINEEFRKHKPLLSYFGYSLIGEVE